MVTGSRANERLVLQAADSAYRELAALAEPGMRRWCRANAWSYSLEPLTGAAHPYVERYALIRRLLESYRYVFWLDLDVVPVTLDDIVYDPSADFHFSVDYNGWCAGAALYRAGSWSRWLIGMLLRLPAALPHRLAEQDELKALLRLEAVKPHVRPFSELQIANPVSRLDGHTPTMFHAWANGSYVLAKEQVRDRVNSFLAACPE